MKIFKSFIWVLVLLVIYSCGSEELSNSKAKKVISKCLEQSPELRTVSVRINRTHLQAKELEKYRKLEDEGYIAIAKKEPQEPKPKKVNSNDPLAKWRYEAELRRYNRNYKDSYDIQVKKKAQKYIDKAPEKTNLIKMKSHSYKVDKVLEVQEIPSLNTAKVKVRFKAIDITPFSILNSKDPSEFWVKDLKMIKTSNGWKYCDEF